MFLQKLILPIFFLFISFSVQAKTETSVKQSLNVMTYMGILDKDLISKFEKENNVFVRVDFVINPSDFAARIKSHMRVYDVMISNQQVSDTLSQANILRDISPLWIDPVGIAYDGQVSKIQQPFSWESLIQPDLNPYWRQRIVTTGLSSKEQLMIALLETKEKMTTIKSKLPITTQKWMDALKKQSVDLAYPMELAFLGNKISAAAVFYSDYLRLKRVVPYLEFAVPVEGTFYNKISAAVVASSFQENLSKKLIDFLIKNRKEFSLKNQLVNLDLNQFKGSDLKNWEIYDEYGFILRRSDSKSP